MTCFACEPRSHIRRPRRALCVAHNGRCELSDGTLLQSALKQAAPANGWLEGSLLGFLFNPVFVVDSAGVRKAGWTDFAGGGMAVYEGEFPNESFFEFWLSGHSEAGPLLDAIQRAPAHVSSIAAIDLIDDLLEFTEMAEDIWRDVITVAERQRVLGRWPASYAELQTLLTRPRKSELQLSSEAAFVSALRSIAASRVARESA